MKINKYKLILQDIEFLVYGRYLDKVPKYIKYIKGIKLIQEGLTKQELDEVNSDLPIYSALDFIILFLPIKGRISRTYDKILSELKLNINTWGGLCTEYYLIRNQQSKLSKREQRMVIDKYSEIINEI